MSSNATSSCGSNDTGSPFNVTVPTALNPTYATLEVICAVLSIVGNSVVIFLFIKKHSLRTVKNCYVISMAVADLLVGLLGIPSALAVSVGLPRNFHVCMIMTSILMLLCTGSIMSLVAVTIDRFWSIMNPLTYPVTMTHNKARLTIFVCWSLSTVIGLLPLFGWHRKPRPSEPRCFFVEVMDPRYLVFIYFATIVVPALFMGAIYSFIFCEVRRQNRKLAKMIAASEPQQQQHRQSLQPQDQRLLRQQLKLTAKTVKSIFIIVVVFLISWFPLYTLNAVAYFCPKCCISPILFDASILLSHYNSVWNPILYGWKMKDFRFAIRKLIFGPQFKLDSSAGA